MTPILKTLSLFALGLAACSGKEITAVAPVPVKKSLQLSPKNFIIGANQSFDVQVLATGFASGTLHQCRLVPPTTSTVTALPGTCRVTAAAKAMPGLLIVEMEAVVDTAWIVIFATR